MWYIPLLLTLKTAGIATIIAFVLGVFFAHMIKRYEFPGRDFLDAGLVLPLVLPPTVMGYYLIVLAGRRGILGEWLHDVFGISLIFTWQGAVIAAAIASFPLVYKSSKAAFEDVDKNLEDAARTLGKSETHVFFQVSVPLAWRGILSGAMIAFARAMGEFGATLMIAGNIPGKTQTLSIAVYDAVQAGNHAKANKLVFITSVVCVAILYISGKILSAKK